MKKKFILWAVVTAAVILGAAGRILLHQGRPEEEGVARRTVIIFDGEPGSEEDFYGFAPPESEDDEGKSHKAQGGPLRPSPSGRGKPSGKKEDFSALKKGISSREGDPGDMKDYLEESERARRARIGKSLDEIKRKVRDWRPSIFAPTW